MCLERTGTAGTAGAVRCAKFTIHGRFQSCTIESSEWQSAARV